MDASEGDLIGPLFKQDKVYIGKIKSVTEVTDSVAGNRDWYIKKYFEDKVQTQIQQAIQQADVQKIGSYPKPSI